MAKTIKNMIYSTSENYYWKTKVTQKMIIELFLYKLFMPYYWLNHAPARDILGVF